MWLCCRGLLHWWWGWLRLHLLLLPRGSCACHNGRSWCWSCNMELSSLVCQVQCLDAAGGWELHLCWLSLLLLGR